jgi:hypothetical protein
MVLTTNRESNPTLPEGLAGNAWEPSKRILLFLTPLILVVPLAAPPPIILNSDFSHKKKQSQAVSPNSINRLGSVAET